MNVSDFEVSAVAFTRAVEADGMAGVSGDTPTAGDGAVASLTLLGLSDVDGTASAVGGAGGSGVLGDASDGAAGGSAAAVATSEGYGSVVRAEADATGGQGGEGGIVLSQNTPSADGRGGAGGQAIGSDATATNLSADGLASSTARQTGGAGGSGNVLAMSAMGGVASGTEASAYGHSAVATAVQTGGAGGSDTVYGGAGADSSLTNAVTGATTGGTLVLSQTAVGGAGGSGLQAGYGGSADSVLSFDDTSDAIAAQSVTAASVAIGGAGGGGEDAHGVGGTAVADLAVTAAGAATATATATGGLGGPGSRPLVPASGGGADATVKAVSLTGPAVAQAVASGGLGSGQFGSHAFPDVVSQASIASSASAESAQGQLASATASGTGHSGTVTTVATTTGSGPVSDVSAMTATSIVASSASVSGTTYGTSEFGLDGTSNNYAFASAMPAGVAAPFATVLGSGAQGSRLTEEGYYFYPAPIFTPEAQTFTTVDSFTVDGSALGGELEAELTGASVSGGGFSSLDFVVDVGGATVVDDAFTSAAAAAAFFSGTTLDLGPVGSGPVAVSFELDLTTSTVGDGFGETFVLGTADAPPCFAAGTRILTEAGEVAVEALAVGQGVVTAAGVLPVVWIGRRRVECRASEGPVRVLAGAFGDGLPARDLVLSPDHAVFQSGVLIPVGVLVDGAAVVRDGRERVTYYHVELERHAILRAEGLPVESYLDTGNRGRFGNAPIVALRPSVEAGEPCAPMMFEGKLVDAVRAGLRAPSWALAS